ncbi:MAG TPA: hypothetical protein VHF91_06340 [Acidimicrobiales bacterium]|nr:hypothetical protein [Acidimicrobiales bacterium]
MSGTTGNAVNGTGIFALGGLGGDAGITLVRAGPGGPAVNISLLTIGASSAVGGSSVATGSANGGAGGTTTVIVNPDALSGDSGSATAQSSATNTGNTGSAASGSVSNPVASSGNSGTTGATGPVIVTPTATNTAILGIAIVLFPLLLIL